MAHLVRLSLSNYRNFREVEVDLAPGATVFVGGNAQGKTALLEAAYTLAIGRSFRADREREVVNFDAARRGEAAYVTGTVKSGGQRNTAVVGYLPAAAPTHAPGPDDSDGNSGGPVMPPIRKQIRVNRQPGTAASLLGRLPVTLFFADDVNLALGAPSERRRYLNVLLSQADREYLAALQRYQAALRNRNGLLRRQRESHVDPDEMQYWDGQLVQSGSILVMRRAAALTQLAPSADARHGELSDTHRSLTLSYRPRTAALDSIEETEAAFREALQKSAGRERATATTAVGPHRDDILILLNGLLAGSYASRGEARTIALALRLAEANYLSDVRADDPVILLDDPFSEMDAARRERVLRKVGDYGQALITTTDIEHVRPYLADRAAHWQVAGGAVARL